jgi:hypothetical protein
VEPSAKRIISSKYIVGSVQLANKTGDVPVFSVVGNCTLQVMQNVNWESGNVIGLYGFIARKQIADRKSQ